MLAKNPTRKALGDTVLGNDMIHTGTAAGGAYQFPEAASLRISFSSVKSNPDILMVQAAEDRPGLDASDCVHRAPNWRVFRQR